MNTGGGRGYRVVGGCNNGCARGFGQGWVWVGQKMRALGIKQVQHHDVRAQRRDIPEGGAANVAT